MLDKSFSKLNRFVPGKWKWILEHGGFKRYFANTGWMFFGQMFSLGVSFFVGAWLARYLGPENFGILNFAVAFVGIFGIIADLGSGSILNRELVKFPEKRDELLGTAFRLKLIGGLIAFSLTVVSVILFPTSPLIKLLVILFSLSFILQAINIISIYFQSEVKSKNNVKALLFATVISTFLKVTVILLDKGVIWIMVVFVLEFLWQGIGFINAYKHYGLKIKNWYFSKSIANEMLKDSWPLMLAGAAAYIYIRIDQVMIGTMMGNLEVGIYAAAVKLVEIWYFIPGIICASLFPAIINAKKISALLYKKRLKALYLLMIGVAVVIAFFSTILAHWIIILLFGQEYLAAVIILQIYVWSGLGFFVSVAINRYFLAENRSRDIFLYNFLSMSVNVILNLILIPKFGVTGAAWATFISYSVGPIVVVTVWWFNGFKANRLPSSV